MGDDICMGGGRDLKHTVILLRHGESQWNSDNRCETFPFILFLIQFLFADRCCWPFSSFDCAQSQQITFICDLHCRIHIFWIFPSGSVVGSMSAFQNLVRERQKLQGKHFLPLGSGFHLIKMQFMNICQKICPAPASQPLSRWLLSKSIHLQIMMIRPTIAFTSLLTRAATTLEVVQQKAGLTNIPVIRLGGQSSWSSWWWSWQWSWWVRWNHQQQQLGPQKLLNETIFPQRLEIERATLRRPHWSQQSRLCSKVLNKRQFQNHLEISNMG